MGEDDRELDAEQTDEIGRRMEKVIDEQDDEVSEHVTPHWELFYDDSQTGAERIVHLHGAEKVPAKVTAHSDGGSVAECNQCGATLEISQATRAREKAPEKTPIS
jgi:hypothetical protein